MLSIPEETVDQVKVQLGGRVRDLRVLLRDGRVVLQGNASNWYAKQLAQHFVLKAVGVTVLVNEIEVQRVISTLAADSSAFD